METVEGISEGRCACPRGSLSRIRRQKLEPWHARRLLQSRSEKIWWQTRGREHGRKSSSGPQVPGPGHQKITLQLRDVKRLERRVAWRCREGGMCTQESFPSRKTCPSASCLCCEKIRFFWSHWMSKARKHSYHHVICFIKTDVWWSRALLRGGSCRHQPGMKEPEVGWLLSSLGAKTSGEPALLMMAVFQLKNL